MRKPHPHWTQDPKNADKLRKAHRKASRTRRSHTDDAPRVDRRKKDRREIQKRNPPRIPILILLPAPTAILMRDCADLEHRSVSSVGAEVLINVFGPFKE